MSLDSDQSMNSDENSRQVRGRGIKRKKISAVMHSKQRANKRPARTRKKPERYGKRMSSLNRDSFFEKLSNNSESNKSNENVQKSNEHLRESNENVHESNENVHESNENVQKSNENVQKSDEIEHELHENLNESIESMHESDDSLYIPEENARDDGCETLSRIESPDSGLNPSPTLHIESGSSEAGDRSDPKTNFEKLVLLKLDEIIKRIAVLEKSSAKDEVRLKQIERAIDRVCGGVGVSGEMSHSERDEFGLPVSSESALDKLENDLTNIDFRKKMVICFN